MNLPVKGTYTLVLENSSSVPVNYNFSVISQEINPPIEPDTIALTLGETIEGNISSKEEQKIYAFDGAIGQKLYFDGLSNSSSIYTELKSPSGVSLFTNNVGSDRAPLTLTEAGAYQLVINSSANTTGDYSFRLLNTSESSNLAMDTDITGTLDSDQQTVLYQFNAVADQKFFFKNLSQNYLDWKIYAPDNKQVTKDFSDYYSDFEVTIPKDGVYTFVYTLAITNYYSDTLDYNFQVVTPEITTTELTLGETVSNSISELGERDIYTFDGAIGQKLYFDGLSQDSNFSAKLISLNGNSIDTVDSSLDRTPFTLTEAGAYQLVINSHAHTTGDYSFRLLDTSESSNLAMDTDITGTFNSKGQTVLYQFNAVADQQFFFNNLSENYLNSTVYGTDNKLVTINSGNYYSDFEVNIPKDGVYTLAITNYNSDTLDYNLDYYSDTLDYNLDYNFRVVTPEITTTELTLGETISSSISESGERDIYTFDGAIGQKLYFDGLSTDSNFEVVLISSNGNSIYAVNTFDDRTPLTLTEAGTYQLIVRDSKYYYDNGDRTGDYSFRLLDVSKSTALVFDTDITGKLEAENQSVLYQFDGIAGQKFFFNNLSENTYLGWTIYAPDNKEVTKNSGYSEGDFSITIPRDGVYSLAITNYTNYNGETSDYSFRVLTPEITTTELTLGETVSNNISEPGEQDIYIFDGAIGQKLYFDGLSQNNNFSAELLSPYRNSIYEVDTSSDRTPFTLSETGTYELIVNDSDYDYNGDTTGDYSFRLLDTSQTTPIAFNTDVTGTIDSDKQAIVYQFNGRVGEKISFNSSTLNYNSYWSIYAPNNQRINSGYLGNNDVETILDRDGIYTLVLESYATDAVDYNFRVLNN